MHIPIWALPVLTMFRPTFSTPTYHRFLVLALAAVLTTGRRTVTNVLRSAREKAPEHMSSYHRVFSRRRWSAWALARLLLTFPLDHVISPGPVLLAGDDPVTKLDFIHLMIGPRQQATSALTSGKGFRRLGENDNMQKRPHPENQWLMPGGFSATEQWIKSS